MSQLKRITESLRQAYESVEGVPESFQKIREDAIAYLSQQGLIFEDMPDRSTLDKVEIIKKEILLVRQKIAGTQNAEVQFQLTEKLAACHEQLFSIEVEKEEQYRTALGNIAANPSNQAEIDDELEKLLAESEVLQIKLRTLQGQAKSLQQAINNRTSDEHQQLVQELAAVQKQEIQLSRELLYNRQAQTLNKLGAPQRIKKKQLSSQISQLEVKKFIQDLIICSIDRSGLLEKIRFTIRKAISDAGIVQVRLRRSNRIDWL